MIMTLKDKFEPYIIRYTQNDVIGYLESDNVPIPEYQEECEKIADDFAIGFLNWYFDKGQWITRNLDVKGLLEIYKKEKKL